MGLDWIVKSKPCKGNEEEFNKLQKKIRILNEDYSASEEIEKIQNQLNEISITPQDTISDINKEELDELDGVMVGGSFVTSYLDFRGKSITFSNLINEKLKNEAYEDHTPEQCIEYANKLELSLSVHNKDNLNEKEKEYYSIIEKGIKWLKFWGNKGHGFHAWF